jgi:hypothetical protein
MMVRALLLVAATATTAFAQAPGDYDAQPAPQVMGPSMVPVEAPPPCAWSAAPHESVMAHRFAVGLSLGHLSLASRTTPADNTAAPVQGDPTEFGVGELAVRFRATLHIELELAIGGGHQQTKDGSQGLDVKTGMLGVRWRFFPEHRWNIFASGGIGGIQMAQQGADDATFKASERPMMQLGVGLERRWRHFALQAELRAISAGPQKDSTQPVMAQPAGGAPAPQGTTTTQPPPPTPTPTMTAQPDNMAGGVLTIGASYYF